MRLVLLAALAIIAAGCSGGPTSPTPTLAPPLVSPLAAAPPPSPTATPAPPTATPAPLVVVGTGGEGVSIRRTPGTSGERIKVWPERTIMLPLGEEQQADGRSWTRVRDPDGNDGWVASEFLVDQATAATLPTSEPASTSAPASTRAAPVATKPAGPTAPLPALRPTFTPAPRVAPASTPVPTAPAGPAAPTAAPPTPTTGPAPKPAGPVPTPTPR